MFTLPVKLFCDDLDNNYQAQTRAFVEQFLSDHGYTCESLLTLPEEKARLLFREALDFAAAQLTRLDAMIRLGQREEDTQMNSHTHERRSAMTRLDHHFHTLSHNA
jgi:hypothetical protein